MLLLQIRKVEDEFSKLSVILLVEDDDVKEDVDTLLEPQLIR